MKAFCLMRFFLFTNRKRIDENRQYFVSSYDLRRKKTEKVKKNEIKLIKLHYTAKPVQG